jgi:hypothetical protein
MHFVKPAAAAASLALALSFALPAAGCARNAENSTQEQAASVSDAETVEAPSMEEAQAIVEDDFRQIAAGFGISQELLDSGAYGVDGFTVTDVSLENDGQTAVATVEVEGLSPYALDGAGTVTLGMSDGGWAFQSAESDSTFEETYVGTWTGTPTYYNETFVEFEDGMPVGDGELQTYTDASDATATVVVSSQSEPDADGVVHLSGSIEFSVPEHVTVPGETTTFSTFGWSVEFTDSPVTEGDRGLYIYVDDSNRLENASFLLMLTGSDEQEGEAVSAPYLIVGYSFPKVLVDRSVTFELQRG